MIELDGSQGEGGGQVLRTALTLSAITGEAFRIDRIRANRAKPGLMRQHLVAVQAAAAVSDARLVGAELGSQSLTFEPQGLHGGEYDFAIGSAGSCTLVLQTLIPALLSAEQPSIVRISGGTHNPLAPPAHFLQRCWIPLLRTMGADLALELVRPGFYPAGGGILHASIEPCAKLHPFELVERGVLQAAYAESLVAGISEETGQRQLETVGAAMGWRADQLLLHELPSEHGPGNALMLTLEHAHVTDMFTGFGDKAAKPESVAMQAVREARRYLDSGAAVGEHLADQLMLPLALAGGGSFTADVISGHARTNADVIGQFLPVQFSFEAQQGRTLVVVSGPGV